MKKKIFLNILIWLPILLVSNIEDCINTASICRYKPNGYRLSSNNRPYRISWYKDTQLLKTAMHRHRDSWKIVVPVPTNAYSSDIYRDSTLYLANSENLFQIYDSFIYYPIILTPNYPSYKKRQLYNETASSNIALIGRYSNLSRNLGERLARMFKKGSNVYFINFDIKLEHFGVHRFYDTIRPYIPYYDSLIYFDNTIGNQYKYYSACIDFKSNIVYTLKVNANWNNLTGLGDSFVYIDKIDLNTGISSLLFKFKSEVFQFSNSPNNDRIDANRLFLFNNKLYIRNCHLQLLEFDLQTNVLRNLPIQFQLPPLGYVSCYTLNELYVDPFGYMYYFNNLKLQRHEIATNLTSYIVQEPITTFSFSSLYFVQCIDIDCSGNFYLFNVDKLLRSTTEIDDTLVSNYDDIHTVTYFWNGDSIITYFKDSTILIDTSVCTSLNFKNKLYTTSGIYNDTLFGTCKDTIITLKIKINKTYNDTLKKSACDSFKYNSINYKNSGTYTFKYISSFGCDSLQTLKLTINPSSYNLAKQFSCTPYLWQDSLFKTSGIYTKLYKTSQLCDSSLVLDLTIGLNDKIKLENGINYTALADSVSYQWFRCNPWRKITNETKKTFTTTTKGSYAVVVSNGTCTDTSVCVALYSSGIVIPVNTGISIYPNPFNSNLTIDLDRIHKEINIKIYDMTGRQVLNNNYQNRDIINLDLKTISKGSYYFQVETDNTLKTFKISKH